MAATTLTIKIDHANYDPFTIKLFKSSNTKFQFKSSCGDGSEFEIPVKGSQQKLLEEITPYYSEGIRSMTFSTNSGSKSKDKVVQSWDQSSKLHQSHLEKAIKNAVIALKAGPVMSQKSKSKHAMMPLVNPKRRKTEDDEDDEDVVEENVAVVTSSAPGPSQVKKMKKNNQIAKPVVKARKHKKATVAPPTIVPQETFNNGVSGNVNQTLTEPMTNGNAAAPVAPGNVLS